MEQKSDFAVKELLWRQKYPVDPTSGLTLFATVLEDDAGRRVIVYADVNRKAEAFGPDGTPIALDTIPFTTEEPSCERQAQMVKIGSVPACSVATTGTALATPGVKVCIKIIGGKPVQVTCPPFTC